MRWPNEPIGNGPLAHFLRTLLRACQGSAITSVVGGRLEGRGSGGKALIVGAGGGGGATVKKYTYQGHDADASYIKGRPEGGASDGSQDVKILKPYLLRGAAAVRVVGGVSITLSAITVASQSRTATNISGTVSQSITPRYLVGDEIQAITRSDGTLIDLNTDGRVFSGPQA